MGATYYRRKDRKRTSRKPWVVVVRSGGEREIYSVATEQDAKAIVQTVHKQELAGANVIDSIRLARAQRAAAPVETSAFPTLRAALPAWIDKQALAGEIRAPPRPPTRAGSRRGCIRTSWPMDGCWVICR